MSGHILNIKINIPPLNASLLERPNLLADLDDNLSGRERFNRQLTLISAPAGFGKTTLARSWLHEKETRSAWYTLDQGDNDRKRFWIYLVSALQSIEPDLGKGTLEMLRSSTLDAESPESDVALLTPLLNELFALKEKLFLCLDDYHLIGNAQIQRDMICFIENIPPTFHLIVTTRSEPPWPLARWRARGNMAEVRQKTLRFSRSETKSLFSGISNLQLSNSQVEALYQKTEGWVTGLQLAAISFSDNPNSDELINRFTGSHRHVFHYLSEEVLQSQPETVREFLMQTSILQRLSAALCSKVTGQDDSASILAELDRKNLFLIPLDNEGTWYRYHPLFADLLLHHLKNKYPDQVNTLHEKAARWFLELNEPGEAIRHALSGERFSLAAEILNKNLEVVIEKDGSSLVQECLDSLPPELLSASPLLAVHKAWLHLIYRGREDAETMIEQAEQTGSKTAFDDEEIHSEFSGMLAVVKAYYNIFVHNFPLALDNAETALALLKPGNTYWRSKVGIISGDARLFSGNPKDAYSYYLVAHRENQVYGTPFLMISTGFKVATTIHYLGRLAEAEKMTRELIEFAREQNLSGAPRTGLLWTLLGDYHRETGSMEEAERCMERGLHLSRVEKPSHGWNCLFKIAFHYSKRQYGEAQKTVTQLEKLHRDVTLPSFILYPLMAWKALLFLKTGHLHEAVSLLAEIGVEEGANIPGGQERCYLALARTIIAEKESDYPRALELLSKITEMAAGGDNRKLLIETLLAKAELAELCGDNTEAEAALEQAVDTGYADGFYQVYIDEGDKLPAVYARLLNKTSNPLANKPGLAEFTHSIYHLLPGSASPDSQPGSDTKTKVGGGDTPRYQGLIEQLTDRELEILELFSQGLSNKEVAAKTFLSPGTVKWHSSNIYGKLGVRGRLQAVVTARKLKLIS